MTARTPKEREAAARRAAWHMLTSFRRPGHDRMNAYAVLSDAARGCAVAAAKDLVAGDVADARTWARAYELLEQSARRGLARHERDRAAVAR